MSSKLPNAPGQHWSVKTIAILVGTIALIANLIAIIVFFSGHRSLEEFFSSAPTPTPVTSASPSPTSLSNPTFSPPPMNGDVSLHTFWTWFGWCLPGLIMCIIVVSLVTNTEGWASTVGGFIISTFLSMLSGFFVYLFLGIFIKDAIAHYLISLGIVILVFMLWLLLILYGERANWRT